MEQKNIFEGAKFGDKFLTRDNKIALYIRHGYRHSLYSKGGWHDCLDDGTYEGIMGHLPDADIVSKYIEPIDEEKLDRFAKEYLSTFYSKEQKYLISDFHNEDDFKAGYRKAKEE